MELENTELEFEIDIQESGPPGEPGPQGLSAYEVYLKNGGELSETEWLESLKGEPGEPGQSIENNPSFYTLDVGGDQFTGNSPFDIRGDDNYKRAGEIIQHAYDHGYPTIGILLNGKYSVMLENHPEKHTNTQITSYWFSGYMKRDPMNYDLRGVAIYINGTWENNIFTCTRIQGRLQDTIRIANYSSFLSKSNNAAYTPTYDYHPATKKYVDDAAATKQPLLTPGENITINENNVISAEGETLPRIICTNLSITSSNPITDEETITNIEKEINKRLNTNVLPKIELDHAYDYRERAELGYYLFVSNKRVRTNVTSFEFRDRFTISRWTETNGGRNFWQYYVTVTGTWDENDYFTVTSVTINGTSTGPLAQMSDVIGKRNTSSFTPTSDYHPATKKYVDDKIVTPEVKTYYFDWSDLVEISLNAYNSHTVNLSEEDIERLTTIINEELANGFNRNFMFMFALKFGRIAIGDTFRSDSAKNGYYCIQVHTISAASEASQKYASVNCDFYIETIYDADSNTATLTGKLTVTPQYNTSIPNYYYVNNNFLSKTNTSTYNPTANYHPATKKYVDDSIASAITTVLEGEY